MHAVVVGLVCLSWEQLGFLARRIFHCTGSAHASGMISASEDSHIWLHFPKRRLWLRIPEIFAPSQTLALERYLLTLAFFYDLLVYFDV